MNYANGKIYKIVCDTTGLVYIGSTIKKYLCDRLGHHVYKYKGFLQKKSNHKLTSYQVLENNNYKIILIELFPCKSKDELTMRERYYIETMDCVNKNIPCRKQKEYQSVNKEKIDAYKKEWYEANKESIKQKGSVKVKCECGYTVSKRNLPNHFKSYEHLKFASLCAVDV